MLGLAPDEVDFLLRRGRELLALEVKAARRFSRSWLGGLKAVGDLEGVVRRVVVHPGPRSLETAGGIEVWSLGELLERLAGDTLWP